MRHNKYKKLIYQVSYDEGATWQDVEPAQYQAGDLIEENSTDCGYAPEPQYRWFVVDGEYVCYNYGKYYKTVKQVSNDNGATWQDVEPAEYGRGSLIENDSEDCGYETVEWVDVEGEYICETPGTQYRWVTVEGEYECSGHDKYSKEKEQISTDNGVTWTDTGNTRAGSLVESNSEDCGYEPPTPVEPQYQWVTVTGEYECSGYDKYTKEKEQVSNDNGSTWTDTGNTRAGSLIEANSTDCGYTPPTPVGMEWTLTDDFSNISGSILQRSDTSGFTVSQGSQSNACVVNGSGTALRFNNYIVSGGYIDTSNVTDMVAMFSGCSNLTSLDLSSFDTSNVTSMNTMFDSCSKLTTLDLSNFNTINVTNMMYMFDGCQVLTSLDLSSFNTSSVTSMYGIFSGCASLTSLNLSSFDTSNVTDMDGMFSGCSKLTTLDLSNFDTSNMTGMGSMFWGCSKLTTLDLSNFNTSNVTYMSHMFWGCSKLTTLDLSNFDISSVGSNSLRYEHIFNGCSSLTTIRTNAAFRDWCIANELEISLPTAFRDSSYSGWVIV